MSRSPVSQEVLMADLLKHAFKGRRAEVGICFNGHGETLEQLLLQPHRFTVFGERFHPMFRAMTRCAQIFGGALREDILFLETRFESLPIAPGRLDALILLGGMPRLARSPSESLVRARCLLRPGGLLIWPQVAGEGFFGRVARLKFRSGQGAVGTPECTDLSRMAMEAGFLNIEQTPLKSRALPWTVTVGRAANRPWEARRFPF